MRDWRWPLHSTTARLILVSFGLQFVVMVVALLFMQQASSRALESEQQYLVNDLRNQLLAGWHAGGDEELREEIRTHIDMPPRGVAVILYAAPDGTPRTGNLAAWPTVVPVESGWRTIDLYRMGGDRPERMGIVTTRLSDGSRLLVGHVVEPGLRLAKVITQALIVSIIASSLLALFGAFILSRILSSRVARISETTHAVRDGALAQRVPTDNSGDVFDDLSQSINAMLDRIEMLVTQLRVMTDGLAHDMRSPVTRMKSAIERAAVDTQDPTALAALDRVGQEADTLLRMLTTALQISRAEAGLGRERFADTRIAEMLDDLADMYGPVAEDQDMTISVSVAPSLHVPLHRELMSQAIGNLIENALKYATGGHEIKLSAQDDGSTVVLRVADDGAGIPADRRSEAMQRFQRLDPARRVPGSGLGLSLVEAIARLHNGDVTLSDNAPGLCVTIRIKP